MKRSVFANFAELNERACDGCPCHAECTDRLRKRQRQLVAMGCELQAMLTGYTQRLGDLEGKEWENLVPLALAHFGNEPRKLAAALEAHNPKGSADQAKHFKAQLKSALEMLDRLLLNPEAWEALCAQEEEGQNGAETATETRDPTAER